MGGRSWLTIAVSIGAAICLASCGSTSSSPSSSSAGTVPVSVTIHDTPPANVTILSFEIHITGASLQPSTSGSPVSLLSAPEEIELEHLQTSSALLGSENVPAGTYNSLKVTFANPQMTILNNTSVAITVGSTTCNVGQVCEITPPLTQDSATVNSNPPFPITLSSNSAVNLSMDFNLDASISTNLAVTPTVTVTSATTGTGAQGGEPENIELIGDVTGVDSANQSFTLQLPLSNQTDTILTTSSTEFDFENDNCSANDFSCLAKGETVSVEAQMANGSLTATGVEAVAAPQTQTAMGTVVSVNTGQNQFGLVLQDVEDTQNAQTLTLGLPVTVTVQSGATFGVNAGGLSLNGLSFSSISNLLLGQEVSVAITGVQTSTSGVTVTTNQVTLTLSEISGTVLSVDAANNQMTLMNLPGLFTSHGITNILVEVGSTTQYENVTSLSSLNANQAVSVSGLLLDNPSNSSEPILLASTVKLRQN